MADVVLGRTIRIPDIALWTQIERYIWSLGGSAEPSAMDDQHVADGDSSADCRNDRGKARRGTRRMRQGKE